MKYMSEKTRQANFAFYLGITSGLVENLSETPEDFYYFAERGYTLQDLEKLKIELIKIARVLNQSETEENEEILCESEMKS
jgi:hypothetical protein